MKAKRKVRSNDNGPSAVPAGVARMGDPAYISVPAAARYLSLSIATIRRFLTQKRLRRFKCGSRTLLLFDEVKGLIQEAK